LNYPNLKRKNVSTVRELSPTRQLESLSIGHTIKPKIENMMESNLFLFGRISADGAGGEKIN
jgi:hypothetical protein